VQNRRIETNPKRRIRIRIDEQKIIRNGIFERGLAPERAGSREGWLQRGLAPERAGFRKGWLQRGLAPERVVKAEAHSEKGTSRTAQEVTPNAAGM
jgi:hypothetical protein